MFIVFAFGDLESDPVIKVFESYTAAKDFENAAADSGVFFCIKSFYLDLYLDVDGAAQ